MSDANGELREVSGVARKPPAVSLDAAKKMVAAGVDFGDAFESIDPADHEAFKAWYVATPGVPTPAAVAARTRPKTKPPESPTGDVCSNCGGSRMMRTGACTTCLDCGTNSGCA